jgi:hypothetical protein
VPAATQDSLLPQQAAAGTAPFALELLLLLLLLVLQQC